MKKKTPHCVGAQREKKMFFFKSARTLVCLLFSKTLLDPSDLGEVFKKKHTTPHPHPAWRGAHPPTQGRGKGVFKFLGTIFFSFPRHLPPSGVAGETEENSRADYSLLHVSLKRAIMNISILSLTRLFFNLTPYLVNKGWVSSPNSLI